MLNYILKRLLLIIPTILGIILLNFAIIHIAPGGPVEQMVARLTASDVAANSRLTSSSSEVTKSQTQLNSNNTNYRGAQGLDPEIIERIEKMYGFDQPIQTRFLQMVKNYLSFDLGNSFYKDQKVTDIILSKMPVSISLGLWTMLIVYLIAIPCGIKKAVNDGSKFDIYTSVVISLGSAIPTLLFAVILIILFAGHWQIFPLRGLTSNNWEELSLFGKIIDYLWHITLPVFAMAITSFASLTMLTKNSFTDELSKQYVMVARAKGATEILYSHIFRNAMLIIIAGFPAAFIAALFTGSVIIETVFSLDGMGLLGFEAIVNRDYPIIFGTLYIMSIIGLFLKIIGDIMYVIVDPRINFGKLGN